MVFFYKGYICRVYRGDSIFWKLFYRVFYKVLYKVL